MQCRVLTSSRVNPTQVGHGAQSALPNMAGHAPEWNPTQEDHSAEKRTHLHGGATIHDHSTLCMDTTRP